MRTVLDYRRDIDGLRAISILFVLGFHFFSRYLSGGFIGVDVFFVISGFLISTIIFHELENGTFSYVTFYSRRIRRIFPALLLMLIVVYALGWFVLLSNEFKQLGKHITGGISFMANLILWSEDGYFGQSSQLKPLLHLWSLGVEEQFYLFWPILLGLFWRYRLGFILAIMAVLCLSFIVNLYGIRDLSSASLFYLPVTRVWELMLGGLLAYGFLHKGSYFESKQYYVELRAWLGLLLLLISLLFINEQCIFPGFWALLPVTGALLLLSTPTAWLNRHVLSIKGLVYIGLISYPLYIWHWIFIAYANVFAINTLMVKALSFTNTFILAVITYEFFEKPIRRAGNKTVLLLLLLASIIWGLGLLTFLGKIAPRNDSPELEKIVQALDDHAGSETLETIVINGAALQAVKGNGGKVLFWGDSFMEQYIPRIASLVRQQPSQFKTAVFATIGACPPLPNVYKTTHKSCSIEYKNAVINYALSSEIDTVVIAARWQGYFAEQEENIINNSGYYYLQGDQHYFLHENGQEAAWQALKKLLLQLTEHKRVYLLLENPGGMAFSPKSLFEGTRFSGLTVKKTPAPVAYVDANPTLREKLLVLAQQTQVQIIDPADYLCHAGKCPIVMADGTPIYMDDASHLQASYVKAHINFLDFIMKNE